MKAVLTPASGRSTVSVFIRYEELMDDLAFDEGILTAMFAAEYRTEKLRNRLLATGDSFNQVQEIAFRYVRRCTFYAEIDEPSRRIVLRHRASASSRRAGAKAPAVQPMTTSTLQPPSQKQSPPTRGRQQHPQQSRAA